MKPPSSAGARSAGLRSKKTQREARTVVFVDEAAFYLLPGVVRTYAPRGCTPVLTVSMSRAHLSLIGGITSDGRLFQQVLERPIAGSDVVRFLEHLLRHLSGKLLVVWDGLPAHRGKAVKDFLRQVGGRIQLERLPSYAPELNPKEGVWRHLKRVELKNLCCHDLKELKKELGRAKGRLRQKPKLITACFRLAGVT